MIIGYARVSTADQNLDRQLDELTAVGCEKILQEKESGSKTDRPVLQTLLQMLGDGDVVVISELTRLSRSTKDLFELVERIQSAGANLKSLKEPWLDTTTPSGKLMFTFVAGIAQFERDIIRLRTIEGIKSARARGRMGGRPRTDANKVKEALTLYNSMEYSLDEIKQRTGVSPATLYRYINKNKTETK